MAVVAAAVAYGAAGGPPSADSGAADDPLGERTGGATTVWADGKNAFSFPAANLNDDERTRFVIGNSFFRRNWVEAPASTRARDGLGPHFIARSCGGCHVQGGRGEPPDWRRGLAHEPPVALLLRLSVPGRGPHGGPLPEPVYGEALQNAAIGGVAPEGRVQMRWTPVHGRFADGTRYTLRKPHYTVRDLAYGPLAAGTMLGPRIAPQLMGVGLLEAIADSDIVANAQAQAAAPGPIKGQVNRVREAFDDEGRAAAQGGREGAERIGRFGWKANTATLLQQTAAAFHGDIGITSSAFPQQTCSPRQADCRAAPAGGGTGGAGLGAAAAEIDDDTLAQVVFYQATLAPVARRHTQDAEVQRGQRLFAQAQCAVCHRPSYVTAAAPFPRLTSPALQGQRIWPYTDLLLHDLGEALADGRPDFAASGRQWKTPPLWGIGLIREVNGHLKLLHDGRADGVLEAVLWHGGEAEASKQQVLKMNRAERAALVKFVESL